MALQSEESNAAIQSQTEVFATYFHRVKEALIKYFRRVASV